MPWSIASNPGNAVRKKGNHPSNLNCPDNSKLHPSSYHNCNILHPLIWYFVFGALHELAHIVLALYFGLLSHQDVMNNGGWLPVIWRAAFERRCIIPNAATHDYDSFYEPVKIVQHGGWIASAILAAFICLSTRGKKNNVKSFLSHAPFVAVVTAAEAFSTDFLNLSRLPLLPIDDDNTSLSFFCGNFGMILLNSAWMGGSDKGKSALDLLEKMINITMMRGAQTGGCLTFVPLASTKPLGSMCMNGDRKDELVAIRSRVVNAKRTDLSKLVRAKLEKDSKSAIRRTLKAASSAGTEPAKQVFFGHTRFATSSKATFGGTHPHRWTPRTVRRMYDFRKANSGVRLIEVENLVTHNGDFDFFEVAQTTYDLDTIQKWLEIATGYPLPAPVDSVAIAGMIDILRTQGCFGLSARYAVCLGLETSRMSADRHMANVPPYQEFESIGKYFEEALDDMLLLSSSKPRTLESVSSNREERENLAGNVVSKLRENIEVIEDSIDDFITDHESGSSLETFVRVTIDAFFDNDLFHATKLFLKYGKGSFGLCVCSNVDARDQVCIGARGQPMSVAFYPKKGVICYGSEQAAVKAGIGAATPDELKGKSIAVSDEDDADVRLDLDDLGGEICLIDWGDAGAAGFHIVSPPNRHLQEYKVMRGDARMVLYQESPTTKNTSQLFHRMTLLEGNEFILPLQEETRDLIRSDIEEIPDVCRRIQKDWRNKPDGTLSLNRLTAWHLSRCIKKRMQAHVDGAIDVHSGTIDILVTGCEVSLWLAEQFASDLQKSFPRLGIRAISSNKILGLFGQDMTIPTIGFPLSSSASSFKDAIVIIVSHSGGTFAPLACSNLTKSNTNDIFVVTSEWDTQIGKQLRGMHNLHDQIVNSRIFITNVGVRPAEPCSLSVAATQQLLTNIFEHICLTIISNPKFRRASGAVINERDLKVLERCNMDNIAALESIVGVDSAGEKLNGEMTSDTEKELRRAGDVWAEHILENAKAYIMSFIYIIGTVTSGYPIISGIAKGAGLDSDWAFYITRFFDALIYFWLPQINIIILRLLQRRNLRHRMVGRTVVIGDCPWVAQAAEAFLSKIFACSYSIAGLNVLSGNPADHLVHRHTHRVVRGSLLICGRPDGRLSALTSLESTVCLSVNQASSIQSIGGTCESITIGHNPYHLPLSAKSIFLERFRPLFLCEHVLGQMDLNDSLHGSNHSSSSISRSKSKKGLALFAKAKNALDVSKHSIKDSFGDNSTHGSTVGDIEMRRSSAALMGAYSNLNKQSFKMAKTKKTETPEEKSKQEISHVHADMTVDELIKKAVKERRGAERLRKLFDEVDKDGSGSIDFEEFVEAYTEVDASLSRDQLRTIFDEADYDDSGELDFEEFMQLAKLPESDVVSVLETTNRDDFGVIHVKPSTETYFGEALRKDAPIDISSFSMESGQHFSMELYESRIASLQRFVSMTVMFHQIGMRVQSFFPRISFGLLGYRMDRTHSIMRIATTASPVSGSEVRERMQVLELTSKIEKSINLIAHAWLKKREARWKALAKENSLKNE